MITFLGEFFVCPAGKMLLVWVVVKLSLGIVAVGSDNDDFFKGPAFYFFEEIDALFFG